ncbi:MAG: hypothetical protein OXD41_03995 [Thaumarchaeota archaeon]|nr:hypothetical protein [Nitrososphaerota archaeon]
MALPAESRAYIDGLVEHYVSEAASYRRLAESFCGEQDEDAAVGMIAGCVYSAFLQHCRDGGSPPRLEDVNEAASLVRARIPDMRRALRGA